MLIKKFTRNAVEEYTNACREEKKIHKSRKKIYKENQLNEIELLRSSHESRAFVGAINEGCRNFKPRITLCKDRDGNIVNEKEKILNRWLEHFNQLLNSNVTRNLDVIVDNAEDQLVDFPTIQEIQSAINKLKNYKAGA